MKKALCIYIAMLICIPSAVSAEDDMVKISGTACEIFSNNQAKSSVRVRVTDKASYNAVSKIPSLAELRSQMLEHDYNVIVYNLVDNYVRNMSVRTTSQDDNELCVEVNGAIPAADVVTVIANYSPSNPAPEYDFKKANGIVEEKNEPIKENKPSNAEVMYNGPKEFDKIPEPTKAEVAYKPDIESESVEGKNQSNDVFDVEQHSAPTAEEPVKTLVYIAPVEFSNNTYSSKPIGVLKNFFSNEEVYAILDNQDGADYMIYPKVLKAKIDNLNSKTRRLQMVVSTELKILGADGSINDHQNRFVLFENDENEQEVAMNLLKKLLQKTGEKMLLRIEHNERKRKERSF